MDNPYVAALLQNIKNLEILEKNFQEYFRLYLILLKNHSSLQYISSRNKQSKLTLFEELENLAALLQEEIKQIVEVNSSKTRELIEILNAKAEDSADLSKPWMEIAMSQACLSFECREQKFAAAVIKALRQSQPIAIALFEQQKNRLNWVGFFFLILGNGIDSQFSVQLSVTNILLVVSFVFKLDHTNLVSLSVLNYRSSYCFAETWLAKINASAVTFSNQQSI